MLNTIQSFLTHSFKYTFDLLLHNVTYDGYAMGLLQLSVAMCLNIYSPAERNNSHCPPNRKLVRT